MGIVSNGIPMFYNQRLYIDTCKALEGQEFELIIVKKHKKPSTSTYGYYRAGIIRFCSQLAIFDGWTEDEIHDYWQKEFLSYPKIIYMPSGKPINKIITISTTVLNQDEMNEYIEKICRNLAEQGIIVPQPETFYLNKYRTKKS